MRKKRHVKNENVAYINTPNKRMWSERVLQRMSLMDQRRKKIR